MWGRFTDKSSHKVLLTTSSIALVTNVFVMTSLWYLPGVLSTQLSIPLLLFVFMTVHHGVRIARSTHLVDMSDDKNRANYVAIANTVIGGILSLSLLIGFVVDAFGLDAVFMIFSIMTSIALCSAYHLDEVQD